MLRFSHTDGGFRYLLCRASAIRDDGGRVVRMVGVHTDVTEMLQIQNDLEGSPRPCRNRQPSQKRFSG